MGPFNNAGEPKERTSLDLRAPIDTCDGNTSVETGHFGDDRPDRIGMLRTHLDLRATGQLNPNAGCRRNHPQRLERIRTPGVGCMPTQSLWTQLLPPVVERGKRHTLLGSTSVAGLLSSHSPSDCQMATDSL